MSTQTKRRATAGEILDNQGKLENWLKEVLGLATWIVYSDPFLVEHEHLSAQ